jgi:hypothetical protein
MTYPHRQKHAVPLAILLLLFAIPALSGMFAQSAIQAAAESRHNQAVAYYNRGNAWLQLRPQLPPLD